MQQRWYEPTLGQFINADPIGFRGGLNKFGYVGGNPTRFSDPSGNIPIEIYIPPGTSDRSERERLQKDLRDETGSKNITVIEGNAPDLGPTYNNGKKDQPVYRVQIAVTPCIRAKCITKT
jgi:uncharacterized protein RhaS with RHS repeats